MMFAGYGLHWERTQTFWPLLGDYHQYLARCSHLLQQGVTVSDILYLTPEGAPHVFRAPASALDAADNRLPDKKGHGFDGCSPRMLIDRAQVKEGLIAFAGGTSYRLLVLPRHATMTPQLLAKLRELVAAGATVLGSPPLKSPSLANYPDCDKTLRSLAAELWGGLQWPDEPTTRRYGHGTIRWGGAPADGLYPDYAVTAAVLKELGVIEDFVATGPVRYGHRRTDDHEIYFLSNKSAETIDADCTFRVGSGQPELWDPVTGTTRPLPQYRQENGRTTIPLRFAPHQSFFAVFPRKVSSKPATDSTGPNFPQPSVIAAVDGFWQVSFDPRWGGPEKVTFDQLEDWTQRPEDGIRHYSGIATYRKTFVFPQASGFSGQRPGQRLYLDLGTVYELARVRLNGRDHGVAWCAPWRIDISDSVKEGTNHLEIEVANLWPNRLIGDAAKPPDQRLSWTIQGHSYNTASKLLPSGLLGPVRILATANH
jgi:hypothetical protein